MLDSRVTNSVQPPNRHEVAVQQLLMVCNTRGRQTKEEWKDWMRRFSNELLK